MARVHRLQYVEGFGAPGFAEDDPVGAHSQGVSYEVALRDAAEAFGIFGPGFQAYHVRLHELQFGRVFNRDSPFAQTDEVRQRVEQGGLAN